MSYSSFYGDLYAIICCPKCKKGSLLLNHQLKNESLKCDLCGATYSIVDSRPVLLSPDNALFPPGAYVADFCTTKPSGESGIKSFIPDPSVNLANKRVLGRLNRALASLGQATVLVVGGGCQRLWLDERLGAGEDIRTIYSDIDVTSDVDLFADAHSLPFVDGVFDAVVTTAVLEHVLYPEQVASEIYRVLKPGGMLYSELPFMQPVHEGAYDFSRYSLSGHRRLFNGFAEIESGMVAGPATALVWAIENFFLAFVLRSSLRLVCKASVRILFFWIKYFDFLLVNKPQAMDAASCTYFLGKKIDSRISDSAIIATYVGAKHLNHI